jgi:hypothetical protein
MAEVAGGSWVPGKKVAFAEGVHEKKVMLAVLS